MAGTKDASPADEAGVPRPAALPDAESTVSISSAAQHDTADNLSGLVQLVSTSSKTNQRSADGKVLKRQSREKQTTLLALLDHIDVVQSEHIKLEGENRFLQSYIGDLMSTSKIISAGAAKGWGKGGKGK